MFFIIPIPGRVAVLLGPIITGILSLGCLGVLILLVVAGIIALFTNPVGWAILVLIEIAVGVVLLLKRAKRKAAEAAEERRRQEEYARELYARQMVAAKAAEERARSAAKEAEKRAQAERKQAEAMQASEARREKKSQRREHREARREQAKAAFGRLIPGKPGRPAIEHGRRVLGSVWRRRPRP